MTEYIAGRMRRISFMAYPESRADYKKSRICHTLRVHGADNGTVVKHISYDSFIYNRHPADFPATKAGKLTDRVGMFRAYKGAFAARVFGQVSFLS